MQKDMITGISIPIIYATGQAVFFSQKIEQKFKRIVEIQHLMGKSNKFEIEKIKKQTLNALIKEILSYGILTDKGKKTARELQYNRNLVCHEIFLDCGPLIGEEEKDDEVILRRIQEIVFDLQSFYYTIWDVWKHYENEYEAKQMLKDFDE